MSSVRPLTIHTYRRMGEKGNNQDDNMANDDKQGNIFEGPTRGE